MIAGVSVVSTTTTIAANQRPHRNRGWLTWANMWLRRAALAVAVGLLTTLCPHVAMAEPDLQAAAVTAPKGPAPVWLVADMISGRILGGKDPYGQHAPASTIKALLAMVVMDQVGLMHYSFALGRRWITPKKLIKKV